MAETKAASARGPAGRRENGKGASARNALKETLAGGRGRGARQGEEVGARNGEGGLGGTVSTARFKRTSGRGLPPAPGRSPRRAGRRAEQATPAPKFGPWNGAHILSRTWRRRRAGRSNGRRGTSAFSNAPPLKVDITQVDLSLNIRSTFVEEILIRPPNNALNAFDFGPS